MSQNTTAADANSFPVALDRWVQATRTVSDAVEARDLRRFRRALREARRHFRVIQRTLATRTGPDAFPVPPELPTAVQAWRKRIAQVESWRDEIRAELDAVTSRRKHGKRVRQCYDRRTAAAGANLRIMVQEHSLNA